MFTCACKDNSDCPDLDGDPCNGTMYCDTSDKTKPVCKHNAASVVICATDKDTHCLKSTCDPKSGACFMAAQGTQTTCEDGDLCSAGDRCDGKGKCAAGTNVCECATAADCLATDDGDLCNGVPYCDTSTPGKHTCKPNPASAIHCPQTVNTQCLQNRCDKKTGKCGLQPFSDGKSCTDGDACTDKDACKAGGCMGGGKTDCNDNNACTSDGCDAKAGCTHKLDNCDDGNTCTVDKCDPKTGKCDFSGKLQDGAACNADNDGCTLNDTCDKGACFAGIQVLCGGELGPCQQSVCVSEGPKQHKCVSGKKDDGAVCDDGQSCTLGTVCKGGQCLSSGKERLWTSQRFLGGKDDFEYVAVGVIGDQIVVGGTLIQRDSAGVATSRRLDLEGWSLGSKQLWIANAKSDDPKGTTRTVEIVPQGEKSGMLVGQMFTKGQDRLYAWRFTTEGKTLSVVSSTVHPTLSARAAMVTAGGIWVTGEAADNDASRIMLLRLSTSGQLSFKHRFDTTVGAQGHSLASLPGATVVIAGDTKDLGKGLRHGLLLRSDAAGKVAWERTFHFDGKATALRAVRTDSKGSITAAGHTLKGGSWHGVVIRTDGAGKELWRRTTINAVQVHELRWLDSGQLLLAGAQQDAVVGDISWLAMMDPIGNPVWQRPINVIAGKPVQDQGRLTRVVPHGDGFAISGRLIAKGSSKTGGFIGRVAGFGYNTCKSAGACAGKAANGCDDNKPCTLDLCDTKTGKCIHSQLDGLLCDPQDGCTVHGECQKGKCVLDPNGKLWTRNLPWEDVNGGPKTLHKGAARVLGLKDGGTFAFGTWEQDTGSHNAMFRKLDHTGALVWQRHVVAAKGTFGWHDAKTAGHYAGRPIERSNGEIWTPILKPAAAGAEYRHTNLWVVDKDGVLKGSHKWDYPDSTKPEQLTAIAEQTDGSTLLAHRNDPGNHGARRSRFVRRVNGKVIAAVSGLPYLITDLLPGPALNTWAVSGDVYHGSCALRRFGPSGVQLYKTVPTTPRGNVCGSATRVLCVTGRLGDGVAVLVQNEFCWKGPSTTAWRFSRFDAESGKYLGQREVKPVGGNLYGSVDFMRGPKGGFAFFERSTNPSQANVYLTDGWGRLRLTRPLPDDASYRALSFAATDEFLIWAGRRVDKDGTIKTGITHTGPWGYGSCTAAGLCKKQLDSDGCDDENACTADVCAADKGCSHTALSCDDGNWCTADSCDKATGCVNKTVTCEDGDICTQNLCDVHKTGANKKDGCHFPIIAKCVDGQRCTLDLCDSKTGQCSHPKDPCNDGDPCTGDGCHPLYGCQTHVQVFCNDENPCTFDQCIKNKGCKYTPLTDGANCEDDKYCKLGPGKCTQQGCSISGLGVVFGCSKDKPTTNCTQTQNDAAGKMNSYVGPVHWDEDNDGKNVTIELCDMKAGGFVRRTTQSELDKAVTIAPGELISCVRVPEERFGWLPPALINTKGKPKPTVPTNFELPVPWKHTAVRVRIHVLGSGGYSGLKDNVNVRIQFDGKTAYDGKYGGFPNQTWNNNDGEHSNTTCKNMHKVLHNVVFDAQRAHTADKVTVAVSLSSPLESFGTQLLYHHVEIWTK